MPLNAVIADISENCAQLADTLGFTALPSPPLSGQYSVITNHVDPETLHKALGGASQGLIEASGAAWDDGGGAFLRHLESGGLGVAVTTATAYAGEIPQVFAQALSVYLREYGFVCPADLELPLHEALANAMIHGNLGVDATTSGTLDDMMRFGELVETALADPERSRRLVWLSAVVDDHSLEVVVEDQGDGFTPGTRPPTDARPHGLDLIGASAQAMVHAKEGRLLMVRWPLEQRRLPRQAFSQAAILIVEDNPFNSRMLDALMRSLGVGQVEIAGDGIQGLAAINRHPPDLVLLDVMMPNMDGLEMCRRLRADYARSDLPVLFITALEDAKSRTACFAAGGNDVISKPIETEEVLARVRVHLQSALLMGKLNAYRNRVRDELESARAAQATLIPTADQLADIRARTGLSIQGVVESSSELGGDFWTLFETGPHQLGFLAADFTGHGLSAAFNVFRLHVLLSRLPRRPPSPAMLLGQLNLQLKSLLKPGQFAALFTGLLDLEQRTLTYSGAAMPPPVLMTDGQPRFLESAGPPLGAFADAEYEQWSVPFPPGASLLVYSDALVESEASGKLVCDDDTLLRWVAETQGGDCLVQTILKHFHAHIPGEPPDDLTLLHIRLPAV